MRRLVVIVGLALGAPAAASEAEAAALFARGRVEFQHSDYKHAYEHFREAYLEFPRPALLYNMARALEELKRYAEAVETLHTYLRMSPDDPDRKQIEQHIRSLEEEQRIQSRVALAMTPPPLPSESSRRRRTLAIALSVTSAAVVGLAVGLGVGLGTRGPSYSSADVGPLKSTP